MTDPNGSSAKVPPFIPSEPPIHPRKNGKTRRVSERGLLSLVTTFISVFSLAIMMAGWLKLTLDVFEMGLTKSLEQGLWTKAIALGVAFLFGWFTAVISIRSLGNLVLPLIISALTWLVLAGIAALYIAILKKLYDQGYTPERFWGYLLMMGTAILVLVGLHLIIEGHDLRYHAIPLLVIGMGQLFILVYRYVFVAATKNDMLRFDILFFVFMLTVSVLMVAHIGLLGPLRNLITKVFDSRLHIKQ